MTTERYYTYLDGICNMVDEILDLKAQIVAHEDTVRILKRELEVMRDLYDHTIKGEHNGAL